MPEGSGDVVLIRRSYKKLSHLSLGGSGAAWRQLERTGCADIPDDNGNLNAGSLPDGRVYLLSNAMPNVNRDPLSSLLRSMGIWPCGPRAHRVRASHVQEPKCPRLRHRHPGGSKQGGGSIRKVLPTTPGLQVSG